MKLLQRLILNRDILNFIELSPLILPWPSLINLLYDYVHFYFMKLYIRFF